MSEQDIIENSPLPGVTSDINVGEIDRKTYIGGSDIAAILGLDPYGKTPLKVYMAKRGELQGQMDPEKELFLKRRKRWEGPVLEMLKEEYGGNIVAFNQRYVDDEFPFMAAEIDFEWADENGELQNGEIKTVSPFAFMSSGGGWGDQGTDEIPINYLCQVMYGLGIKKRQRCVLAAMVGLDNMVFYQIEADPELIADIRKKVADFWFNHVVPGVEPDPITMSDVTLAMRKFSGKPVDLDAEALANLREMANARAMKESSEAAAKDFEFKVAKFVLDAYKCATEAEFDGNAELRFGGEKVGTWNKQKHSHLDQQALAEQHPEIKKALTISKMIRVMRITKPKKG